METVKSCVNVVWLCQYKAQIIAGTALMLMVAEWTYRLLN